MGTASPRKFSPKKAKVARSGGSLLALRKARLNGLTFFRA
jgi:hypothetical protein